MYSELRKISKFATKCEVDSIIGKPKCQITDRLVYYYGNGILIAYSPKKFEIRGTERREYGEIGLYAILVYHFSNVEILKTHFKINSFEVDDIMEMKDGRIDEGIIYGMSFQEVRKKISEKQFPDGYREGETYILEEGKLKVQNLFIMYDKYTLFFWGKSKKGKISGFQYTLSEQNVDGEI